MTGTHCSTADDAFGEFGTVDIGTLRDVRDLVVELEPLVAATTFDDPLDAAVLSIELSDGVGRASAARFDVRWSVRGSYSFHFTDDRNRDFRFDRHPTHRCGTSTRRRTRRAPVEPSCIGVAELPLVTRAVVKRWRHAYETGTLDGVNDAANPP